jgi:hypothetical protein
MIISTSILISIPTSRLTAISILVSISVSLLTLMATPVLSPFSTTGVHSYIDHLDGHPRLASPHGRYAGRYLRENCQGVTKDLWWKNHGHDHFLIFRCIVLHSIAYISNGRHLNCIIIAAVKCMLFIVLHSIIGNK